MMMMNLKGCWCPEDWMTSDVGMETLMGFWIGRKLGSKKCIKRGPGGAERERRLWKGSGNDIFGVFLLRIFMTSNFK